jgi:threonine/homoserine/homoserine lactone efflux protein
VVTDLLLSPEALFAWSAYLVGSASPGPSNLAIMATAMGSGRRAAMVFAAGEVSGAAVWALLAAVGLSALLATYSQALVAIKIAGGLYLLWLAWRAARSAFRPAAPYAEMPAARAELLANVYARGVAMHLTNPKAIFVGGYALLFSTAAVRRGYLKVRRAFEGVLAVVFAIAGLRLLGARA